MTNEENREKFRSVLSDMEEAAATKDQRVIALVSGGCMARVLSIILHLIQRQDELQAEIDRLKTPQFRQY